MIGRPEEMAATVQRIFVCFAEFLVFFCSEVLPLQFGRTVMVGGYWVGTQGVLGSTTGVLQSLEFGRTINRSTYCELERFHELPWAASQYCNTAARCRVTKHELERFHELPWAASRCCNTAARCRVTEQCAGQHAHDRVSGSLSVAPNQSGCADSMPGDDAQHEQEYAETQWLSTRPIQHGHNLVG